MVVGVTPQMRGGIKNESSGDKEGEQRLLFATSRTEGARVQEMKLAVSMAD